MKNHKSFILYTTHYALVQKLNITQRGHLLDYIFQFVMGEEVVINDPILDIVFTAIAEQISCNKERYDEICEKRKLAGRKGGAKKNDQNTDEQMVANGSKCKQNKQMVANGSKCKQNEQMVANGSKCKQNEQMVANGSKCKQNKQMQAKQANGSYNDNDNDNDNDNENDNENENENENDNEISSKISNIDAKASTSKIEIFDTAEKPKKKGEIVEVEKKIDEETKIEKVKNAWNLSAGLNKITNVRNRRLQMLKARIRENGVDSVLKMIEIVSKSNFLHGGGSTGFIANFDWCIRPNNFDKIISGNYNNKPTITTQGNGNYQQPQAQYLSARERTEYERKFKIEFDIAIGYYCAGVSIENIRKDCETLRTIPIDELRTRLEEIRNSRQF